MWLKISLVVLMFSIWKLIRAAKPKIEKAVAPKRIKVTNHMIADWMNTRYPQDTPENKEAARRVAKAIAWHFQFGERGFSNTAYAVCEEMGKGPTEWFGYAQMYNYFWFCKYHHYTTYTVRKDGVRDTKEEMMDAHGLKMRKNNNYS